MENSLVMGQELMVSEAKDGKQVGCSGLWGAGLKNGEQLYCSAPVSEQGKLIVIGHHNKF